MLTSRRPHPAPQGIRPSLALWFSLATVMLFPGAAMADTPMGYVLCVIVWFVWGDMGRALATLAVIVVGVGASVGKVSWGLAITVAVGISVIFGADELVVMLVPGVGAICPL